MKEQGIVETQLNAEMVYKALERAYVEMADTYKKHGRACSRDLASDLPSNRNHYYFWTRQHANGRICFANIRLAEEMRGQGIFTRLLKYVEDHPYDFTGVEVESCYEPRLVAHLRNLGWEDDAARQEKRIRTKMEELEAVAVEQGRVIPNTLLNLILDERVAVTLWKDWA